MDLGVVVPCYNEDAVLDETAKRLSETLYNLKQKGRISPRSKIYFVDDGSTDKTWEKIKKFCSDDRFFSGIKLSKNKGHQNALLAGLLTAKGDALISIDADLQHDVNIIEKMVDEYSNGNDLVYGVRENRETDSLFKKLTAIGFYRLMKLLGVDIIYNHADFRLMSRRVIDCLREFQEVNLFLRALVTQIGFKYSIVYYEQKKRYAGETKYPLKKMISFAVDGITSFSAVPLRIISFIGLIIFVLTIGMSIYVFWVKFFSNSAVPGWASTVLPIYLIGGIQIVCIGIIGEYLSKIYNESKARPRYIIEEII